MKNEECEANNEYCEADERMRIVNTAKLTKYLQIN